MRKFWTDINGGSATAGALEWTIPTSTKPTSHFLSLISGETTDVLSDTDGTISAGITIYNLEVENRAIHQI